MGNQFQWVGAGSGAFGDPLDWEYSPNGTIIAYGVPGPADTAVLSLLSHQVSGNGNVGTLTAFGQSGLPAILQFTGSVAAGNIGIGNYGTVIVSGGTLVGNTIFNTTALSQVDVTNGGSVVGPAGQGTQISDYGGFDVNGGSIIAYMFAGYGSVTVESGMISTTEFGIAAGSLSATASLLATGGTIATDIGYVGCFLGGGATATIQGSAVWHNRLGLGVGSGGPGSLILQGGGRVDAGAGYQGTGPVLVDGYSQGVASPSGTISISGSGSELTADGDAQIGLNAPGALSVSNAGTFTVVNTLDIGVSAGGIGSIALDGTASALTAGRIVVGDAGIGTLTVNDGAVASTTGDVSIGAASGTGAATIASGGSLQASGSLTVGAVGVLTVGTSAVANANIAATVLTSGSLALQGGTLSAGTISVAGTATGFGAIVGALTNTGTVVASGGTLTVSADAEGTGTMVVGAAGQAGTLELQNGAAKTQTIVFNAGMLKLDQLSTSLAPIAGFGPGDTIEVGTAADAATFGGGTLTLTALGITVGTLALQGAYQTKNFTVADNILVSDIVFNTVACFAAGTRLLSADGEVAVERLRVGDRLIARFDGDAAPIRWIGRRVVRPEHHPRPETMRPVLVRAHAFGTGQPRRDLLLSPDHAIFVEDVLIPVKYLIDDVAIRQLSVDTATYYHVELARHDVVLAEGLAVESFLDTGNRDAFENGGGAIALHPDFAAFIREAECCAPLVVTGPELARARRRVSKFRGDRCSKERNESTSIGGQPYPKPPTGRRGKP